MSKMPNAKEFESDSESERTRSDDTWSMSQGLVADRERLVKFPRAQRDYASVVMSVRSATATAGEHS